LRLAVACRWKTLPRPVCCARVPAREAETMSRLKITQTRSGIGNKQNQRETLRSLGLKRIHDVVVKEDRPEIRGMVHTVTHLVSVEEVE
jgi:large subunit ribosomal protein L30